MLKKKYRRIDREKSTLTKNCFGPIVRHTQGRSVSKVKIIGSGSVAVWGATKGRGTVASAALLPCVLIEEDCRC